MIKKQLCFMIGCGLLIILLTGCASLKSITQPASINKPAGIAVLPPYSGPKAKIAVPDFEVKVAKAGGEIGSGLREMLIGALINSARFKVVERQAGIADLIISATVIEFAPQASGGRAGVGGGGGAGSGRLGGLLGTSLNKAHIALDIRITDAWTSKVINARRVQGQASDISGDNTGGFFGALAKGNALSIYVHTPMEKAIQVCMVETVRYISGAVPTDYYKTLP